MTSPQLTTTSRSSTMGKPCVAHHSLSLHQDLILFGCLDRSLPLHQDPQLLGGLVTPPATYQYIKIFNSCESSRRSLQLDTTSRSSTLGRPRDHPPATYHYIKDLQLLLRRLRGAHRSLPLHQDLQFLGGFVTHTAAYHYMKGHHYVKIFISWETL